MTTISAIYEYLGTSATQNCSLGSRLVERVFGRQTRTFQKDVAQYLERHRYDLPPQVWIELERRHSGM
jgi:hypothetical protein